MSTLRVTQTLLGSWLRVFSALDPDAAAEEFIKTLKRERIQQTPAMLDGIRFENCVNSVLDGAAIGEDHEWFKPVRAMAYMLRGAQQQVTVSREVKVDGVPILLHGVFDYLRGGVIYDCKFSKNYKVGKYRSSPQHPMYLALAPEAYEFQYLISDGSDWISRERYTRDICEPIETTIHYFLEDLDRRGLSEIFIENWRTK